MGATHTRHWSVAGFLLLLLALCAQQAVAFEGDYIWEERFNAGLSKAQSGQAKDQYAVGDMYFRGRGTEVNAAKALHWFLLAAKQGHKKAAYKAGYLYLYGNGAASPISPKKAFPWMKKAAVAGYVPAQYELGRLYFAGKLVKRNQPLALKWLGRAKLAGYAPARTEFDKMVKRLVKAQKVFPKRGRATKAKPKKRVDFLAANAPDLPDPKGIILRSKWGSSDGPSTFLPSRLTQCRESSNGIECLSSKLDVQLASTRVVYRRRTKITNINADGQFRLAYANNVLSSDTTSSDEAAAVKAGLQRNEHVLNCSLLAGRTISCAQGTRKQYRFFGRY